MIYKFVLGPFSQWLPSFVYLGVWLYALRNQASAPVKKFLGLAALVLLFNLVFALILSFANYQVWAADPFSKIFLKQPLSPETPLFGAYMLFGFLKHVKTGYFLFHVLNEFWLKYLYAAAAALIFYALLQIMRAKNPSALDNSDCALALLLGILSGWPGFFVFLPLAFLSLITLSIYNVAVRKIQRTALSAPFLFASLIPILLTPFIFKILPFLIFLNP